MSNVLRAIYYNTILKKSFYDVRIFENFEQVGRKVFLNKGDLYFSHNGKSYLLPKRDDKPLKNGLRIYGFYDSDNPVPCSVEDFSEGLDMMERVNYKVLKSDYVDAETFNSILNDHFIQDIFHSEDNILQKYWWLIVIGVGALIIFMMFGGM
ncbi:hypothetical protein KO361_05375 [Candidatus Woesearchaeota archaeon]|jgi:hypothetical protein|nr:hypothetical protein [Candidatus Woesearchaeota archaeon]